MVQSVNGPWFQVGIVSYGKDDEKIASGYTIGQFFESFYIVFTLGKQLV